jgi:hypothetical protein
MTAGEPIWYVHPAWPCLDYYDAASFSFGKLRLAQGVSFICVIWIPQSFKTFDARRQIGERDA